MKEKHGAEHLNELQKVKKKAKKRYGSGIPKQILGAKERIRAVIKQARERTVDETAVMAQQIEEMAGYGSTLEEIASVMGVDRGTIEDYFMPHVIVGRNRGHQALRKAQYDAAIRRGSNAMLHWLGKIELEQRERTDKDALNESLFRKYLDKHVEEQGK